MKEKIKQEKLFKEDKSEPKIKARKPSRKKGIVSIHLGRKEKYSIEFNGDDKNEITCKNEVEVMKEIERIKSKYDKEYKIEVKDLREEEKKRKKEQKDKKVTIVIKHDYSSDWKTNLRDRKPIEHLNGFYEGDYDGFIGGCGSEGFDENEKLPLEQVKEKMINWLKSFLLEDFYNPKNISIKEISLNKDTLKEWETSQEEELKREIEYAEKDIEIHSKKLKEAFKIKFGYPVTINVLKE